LAVGALAGLFHSFSLLLIGEETGEKLNEVRFDYKLFFLTRYYLHGGEGHCYFICLNNSFN